MTIYSVSLIIGWILCFKMVQSYVQCGGQLCHGASAHCCTWDEQECCFLSWYTVWWVWVGAILFMTVMFAVVVCCFRNRRRSSSARHMIVVTNSRPFPSYGSYTSTPCRSYAPSPSFPVQDKFEIPRPHTEEVNERSQLIKTQV